MYIYVYIYILYMINYHNDFYYITWHTDEEKETGLDNVGITKI